MKLKLQFKALLSLVAVMCLGMFQSCSESGPAVDTGRDDLPELAISTETLAFDANGDSTDGKSGKVTITTDGSWFISADVSSALSATGWGWTIDNKSGSGDGDFTLSLTPTTEPRTAKIIVSAYSAFGKESCKEVTVAQAGAEAAEDKDVKVSELVAMMGESSATFGAEYNYILDVVVTEVSSKGVVYAQQAGATTAGEGIAMVGANLAASYASGDQLTVTVPAGIGTGLIDNGAAQLNHSTLTVVKGDNAPVEPIEISAADLNSNAYANMFVTVKDVKVDEISVWTDGKTDGHHRFFVGATSIVVFAEKGATELVDSSIAATTGDMSGIGGTSQIKGALSVSKASHVSAFELTTPLIDAITPKTYSFPCEGGEATFEMSGANLKDAKITLSAFTSSQFTASVDNSTATPSIKITAAENKTEADVAEETITVSVEGGNSYEITISQADGFISIYDVCQIIKSVGPTSEEKYEGESFKFKAVVASVHSSGNLNLGQFALATEGTNAPGTGLIMTLGGKYSALVDTWDFQLGEELIITINPKSVDADGNVIGVGMNHASIPMLVSFNGVCSNIERTGRKDIAVEPAEVTGYNFGDYMGQLVRINLSTLSSGGTLSSNKAGATNWVFNATGAGKTIGFKTSNNPTCVFYGVPYKAATGFVTGIAQSYKYESFYIYPRTLEDFADYLTE